MSVAGSTVNCNFNSSCKLMVQLIWYTYIIWACRLMWKSKHKLSDHFPVHCEDSPSTSFNYCYNGVRLCLCETAATNRPIVHPPISYVSEYGAAGGMIWTGKCRFGGKPVPVTLCPDLSHANPRPWQRDGSNCPPAIWHRLVMTVKCWLMAQLKYNCILMTNKY
jgi:hypothetical protein